MYITKFQIQGYKSYLAPKEVALTPGFNVIVGQNNAGKTALVEALSLHFDNKLHTSMKTSPERGISLHDPFLSTVEITFQLAAGEVEQLFINSGSEFYVPVIGGGPDMVKEAANFLEQLHQSSRLKCIYRPNSFVSAYLESVGELAAVAMLTRFKVNIPQQQLEHAQSLHPRGSVTSEAL
ncbi:MAG: AAA family ATPase [Ktedonobacteraceae bacterium]|nr:AAA family ATPase [Ktedonobacteraceae bacterium]